MHLNYTAREGGDVLRHAADAVAQEHLPGSGWCFLDVRHDFPDAWETFRTTGRNKTHSRELRVRLSRKLFPYLRCNRQIRIDKVALLFETPCQKEPGCEVSQCACPEHKVEACHKVKFAERKIDEDCECEEKIVYCVASQDWRELYYGLLDTHQGILDGNCHRQEIRFKFPAEAGEISRVFLFCHYCVATEVLAYHRS
jgi:hypothetical protein